MLDWHVFACTSVFMLYCRVCVCLHFVLYVYVCLTDMLHVFAFTCAFIWLCVVCGCLHIVLCVFFCLTVMLLRLRVLSCCRVCLVVVVFVLMLFVAFTFA